MSLPDKVKQYMEQNMNWNHLLFNLDTQDRQDFIKMYYYFQRDNYEFNLYDLYDYLVLKGVDPDNAASLCSLLFAECIRETFGEQVDVVDRARQSFSNETKKDLK
ncbi:MAG: hypothetical protein KGI25_03750 [Thaumarchaeota archaeon]|nr:hypothetical protein [Nitrososphaerota archaeon]